MEQNKVRTYLFYAIGEILLVVIGILIALQVNNWNEERRTVSQKNELLISIKNDLSKDLDQIGIVRADFVEKDENGMYLMSYLNSDRDVSGFDTDRLRRGFMESNDVDEFFPIRLGYNELVSTGAANRIEDDSLKQLLFDHYETSIRERGEFLQRERYGIEVTDGRFAYISNLALREKVKSKYQQGDWVEDPYKELNLDWEKIRAEGVFSMYLGRLLAVQLSVVAHLDETESNVQEMIRRINIETKGR
ncbi:MAG: DUF6090 family protein [Balneolaceae bacterium]|nr:DUF6090 family protein [Balneolaceae bacterium]